MSCGPAFDRAAQAFRAVRGDDGGIQPLANLGIGATDVGVEAYQEEGVSCFAAPGPSRPDQAPERNPTRSSDEYFGFFFHRVEYRLHRRGTSRYDCIARR